MNIKMDFNAESFMIWLTNDVKTLADKESRIDKLTEEQSKEVLKQIAKIWTK